MFALVLKALLQIQYRLSIYMWPSRHGLGAQLGYGLQGASYHSESLDPESPWKFARQRDGGLALSEVRSSKETLVLPQISDLEVTNAKDNTFKSVLKDVPADFMEEIVKNEEFLSSEYVYDPTYCEMIQYSTLKTVERNMTTSHAEFVAYVTDPSSCTINIHFVERTKNFIMTKDERFDIFLPTLSKGCSYEFDSPIKQIQFCQDVLYDTDYWHVLIVRTATDIHLLHLRFNLQQQGSKKHCNLNLRGIMKPSHLNDENFAYVSASPFDNDQFLAVDIKGNWGLGRLKRGTYPSFLKKGRIFDPDETSSFKRVIWTNDKSIVYIMGRTYIKQFNLETMEKKDILSAGKYAEFRDFKQYPEYMKYGLLLTSRELIWIDLDNGFKRLISWKHYLDSSDPSLTLSIRSLEDITFVIIHSQVHPIIFIYQFNIENGLLVSLRDPIMVNTGKNVPANDYAMVPSYFTDDEDHSSDIPPALTIFRLSTQLEVSRLVVSTLNSSTLVKNLRSREKHASGVLEEPPSVDKKASMINENIKKLLPLTEKLFHQFSEESSDAKDDATIFQEFASKLNFPPGGAKAPFSLISHAESIKGFHEFEEFDNLMEQLQEHCKEQGLGFLSLEDTNKHLLKDDTKSINKLYDQLRKVWNSNNPEETDKLFTKYITRDLALSSSVIYNPEKEESKAQTLMKKLPKKLRNIVDKWDEGFEEQEEDQTPSQFLEAPEPTIKPIVTVSQSQQPNTASNGLLRPSQRAQSLISRPQPTTSQVSQQLSQSQTIGASQSSKPKKKKRRIKGFG